MVNLVIGELNIEVSKKKIKNIHLSVHPPDGRVKVSVPERMSEKEIRAFMAAKLAWIEKQRAKFKLQERQAPLEFITGENHDYFGEKYTLIVRETSGKQRVEIQKEDFIYLYVRPASTKEKRAKIMTAWYRQQLKNVIPPYIARWEKVMGVDVKEWGVKLMKTKWGTCNTQASRIWLNLELAKKKPQGLEYIIVHEMTHLLEHYHNKKFYDYLDHFLPDWKNTRSELNGINQ